MCFAAIALPPESAVALLDRYRDVTGLRGELKGSRIGLVERALFFEIFHRFQGRAWVSVVRRDKLEGAGGKLPEDVMVYQRLLETILDRWRQDMESTGEAAQDIIIDAGRYDAELLQSLQRDLQQHLGSWAHISVADSRRSAGIQIADVVANSIYNLATASNRSARIRHILAPFIKDHSVRVVELEQI